MNDTSPERDKRPSSLTTAIRAARVDEAERSQALGDLRGAEIARLELLKEALEPVLAQIPAEVDLFDTGIVPGERPRLFVDMISFVEMGRDRRTYRVLQDTRNGRIVLAETETVAGALEAVTRYIARRLVEREKTLAALPAAEVAAPPPSDILSSDPSPTNPDASRPATAAPRPPRRRSRHVGALGRAMRLAADGLGLLALVALAWIGYRVFGGHLPHR